MSNSPQPMTSASLLLRIRDPKDRDAWREFEAVYAPFLRAWCRRKGVGTADSDDVVQEVLAVVARTINRFDYQREKGGFRAWLATVAARELRDHSTQRATRAESVGARPALASAWHEGLIDGDPDWAELFTTHILEAACNRVRPSFSPQTWHCFEATWLANREAGEVAEALGIPVHSVYVNKSRVLKRLEVEVRLLADDLPWLGDVSPRFVASSPNGSPAGTKAT